MRSDVMTGEPLLKTQTKVCCLLIAVMLVMSFLPIYSVEVEVPSFMESAMDQVESVLNDPLISDGEDIDFVLPERLNVNLLLFIKAGTKISDIVELYKSIMEVAEYRTATSTQEYYQAYNKLQIVAAEVKDIVRSNEFLNMMALAAVITSSADDSLNLTIMVTMILMTVILPSSLLITFIIALVGWLILRKNTERAYLFMMRTFRRGAKVFLIVLALGLLDSSIRMSFGIIMALLACMAGFVFCGIASRFKYHTPVGKKYLNIVQISSLVKVAAFFGCYICTAKSGILGKYTAVLSKDFLKNIFSKDYGQEFLEQYLFMLGALVVIIALCVTLFSLMGTLSRLGGMLPRNKETGILSSIMSAVLIAVPAIESTTDWRISLDNGQKSLLVIAATFTFVMIVSDISIKFLRYLTCPDLRETEKDSILRGLQAVETELFDEPEKDLTDEEVEEAYKIFQAQKHLG